MEFLSEILFVGKPPCDLDYSFILEYLTINATQLLIFLKLFSDPRFEPVLVEGAIMRRIVLNSVAER